MRIMLIGAILLSSGIVSAKSLECNVDETDYSVANPVTQSYVLTEPIVNGFADFRAAARLQGNLVLKVSAITGESSSTDEVVAITFLSDNNLLVAAYGKTEAHGTFSRIPVVLEVKCSLRN